jgi:hypothetical protein
MSTLASRTPRWPAKAAIRWRVPDRSLTASNTTASSISPVTGTITSMR